MGHRIRVISASEIAQAITMRETIDVMGDIYSQLSAGTTVMPIRMVTEIEGTTLLYKPAASGKDNVIGIKMLSQVEENRARNVPVIQGLVFLIDLTDGRFLSIMDGTYLTALRTGAASGFATRSLARKDTKIAAIFGAGAQGRTQILAVDAVCKLEKVYIFDKNEKAIATYISEMSGKIAAKILPGKIENLKKVDVICTATGAQYPLFSLADVKPGVHINAIGSYKPNMQEIDPAIVAASRLYLDHIDSVIHESGDIIRPLDSGMITHKNILGEIGDVVNGRIKGRLSDNDITLFKSVGVAVQDLATAYAVYRKAEKLGMGQIINL